MTLSLNLAVPVRTLVLIGGGEFSFGETREIDELLLEKMPADRRVIAFLPTASGSAEYGVHIGRYFRELGPGVEVVNVPVYRGRDARRQKSLATLAGAGMIYLGGGVANNLLETVRESATELAMREAAGKGVVIAAIGAAASSFGAYVRDAGGARGLPGLGWLANTVIDTGFDPQNDSGLRRLMSLPDVTVGIGLPSKTALVIDGDGKGEVAGEGQIALFRKA